MVLICRTYNDMISTEADPFLFYEKSVVSRESEVR